MSNNNSSDDEAQDTATFTKFIPGTNEQKNTHRKIQLKTDYPNKSTRLFTAGCFIFNILYPPCSGGILCDEAVFKSADSLAESLVLAHKRILVFNGKSIVVTDKTEI